MTRLKRRYLLLFALIALTTPSPGQDESSARSMSLKECVLIALQQAFELQISSLNQGISESQVRSAQGAYDPTFTASLNYSDVTSPGGFDTRTGDFVDSQSKTFRSSVGLTTLLPTGGSVTIGASASDTNGTSGPFDFTNASGQGPFIELRQPLLENFAIDDIRLNIQISRQNVEISALDLRQTMLSTINRVEETYYDLVASRENVRVQEASLQLAEELLRDNEKRVALGASAPLEAAETRSQVSSGKASLLSSQRFVRVSQNALKGAMVSDYLNWRQLSILPSNELSRVAVALDFNESWTQAQQGRPDLLTSQLQLDQQELILRRRDNQLLPQLDLTAGAGLAGSANELSQVRRQITRRDAPYYSLGLSLSLPLTNRTEKEAVRIAAAQAQQARVRFKQLRQGAMIQVDDAISQAQTSFDQLAATREAREFAEQALANEQAKLSRGASTSFVVLRLQGDVTRARSQEIQSLTDYNKALSRLRLVEGNSLATYQILLTETE